MPKVYTIPSTLNNEEEPLSVLVEHLKKAKSNPSLIIDGKEFPLSSSLSEAISQLMGLIANRKEVAIVPINEELTAQQAAQLLGVSRPHLVKLLQAESIPYAKTGSHYRILASDLLAFKQQREERRARLNQLTELMQEEGFYDESREE